MGLFSLTLSLKDKGVALYLQWWKGRGSQVTWVCESEVGILVLWYSLLNHKTPSTYFPTFFVSFTSCYFWDYETQRYLKNQYMKWPKLLSATEGAPDLPQKLQKLLLFFFSKTMTLLELLFCLNWLLKIILYILIKHNYFYHNRVLNQSEDAEHVTCCST